MRKKNKLVTTAGLVELTPDNAASVNGGSGRPLFGLFLPPQDPIFGLTPQQPQPIYGLSVNPDPDPSPDPIYGLWM
jgi:hypothetical protein